MVSIIKFTFTIYDDEVSDQGVCLPRDMMACCHSSYSDGLNKNCCHWHCLDTSIRIEQQNFHPYYYYLAISYYFEIKFTLFY